MNVDAESTAGKLAEHISQLNEDASLIAEYQVLIDGAQTQLLILKYLEHIDLVCSQDNTKGFPSIFSHFSNDCLH